jgi:hypothetical protein
VKKSKASIEARNKALEINQAFIYAMDEEREALSKAFGNDSPRITEMAGQRALKRVREAYPFAVLGIENTTMWDVMKLVEKLRWFLNFGGRPAHARELRTYHIFVNMMSREKELPYWAYPYPQNVPIVELNIGIRREDAQQQN